MYYSELSKVLGDIPHRTSGNLKVKCPKCGDSHREKRRKDLSVNYETGKYNCHSGSCDLSGNVQGAIKKQEFEERQRIQKMQPKERTDIKPFQTGPIKPDGMEFLKSRGFSDDTIQKNKIAQSKNWICLNYYNGDEITAAKYRNIESKRFYQHADCEASVYNLNGIKHKKTVIVCEGEFDALSYFEIGLTFAVSVNQGAPNPNDENADGKLKCIDNGAKYFKDKERIYISVDNDAPGHRLESELISRFGRSRCWIIKYLEGCKDANDVLTIHGKEKLKECFDNAQLLPVSGVIALDQVKDKLIRDYRHGVSKGETTRMPLLDPHFTWMRGDLNVFTGLPNTGKSEFVKFLMVLKSMMDGWKWAIFTPEHAPAEDYYTELIEMITGQSCNKIYRELYMDEPTLEKAIDIIKEHFFFIYPKDEMHSPENIFNTVKDLCASKGIDGYLIDPWNQLIHVNIESREDLYIALELTKLDRLNKEFNICGTVVAHPKGIPPNQDGSQRRPTGYDISGGPMWMNKAYNLIVVHRERMDGKLSDTTTVDIQKIKKQKRVGKPGVIDLDYDFKTGWYFYSDMDKEVNPMKELSKIMFGEKKPVLTESEAMKRASEENGLIPF